MCLWGRLKAEIRGPEESVLCRRPYAKDLSLSLQARVFVLSEAFVLSNEATKTRREPGRSWHAHADLRG
jgi:hypothetical protein